MIRLWTQDDTDCFANSWDYIRVKSAGANFLRIMDGQLEKMGHDMEGRT